MSTDPKKLNKNETFPYRVGEKFKRSEMHKIVGGSFRHGMTSCSNGTEFLLFHDSKKNKKFGYDVWEGAQIDGSFHYTGQGTIGDQKLNKSNKALIKSDDLGHKIHLIESNDGICTYIGEFMLGEPQYEIRDAPDVNKHKMRKVFVFKLIPVTKSVLSENNFKIREVGFESKIWTPPNSSTVVISNKVIPETSSQRHEHKLQADFGNYMIQLGHKVENYEFKFENFKGRLKPDLWIADLNYVVEAKASSAREYVRLGIGQVLDYVNLAKIQGIQMKPALLLPNLPTSDLKELVSDLGITLIVRDMDSFVLIEPK